MYQDLWYKRTSKANFELSEEFSKMQVTTFPFLYFNQTSYSIPTSHIQKPKPVDKLQLAGLQHGTRRYGENF